MRLVLAVVLAVARLSVMWTLLSDKCSYRAFRIGFGHRYVQKYCPSRLSPLRGLRSTTTSEELKLSSTFRSNGRWNVTEAEHGMKVAEYLGSAAAEIYTSPTACKKAIRKGLVRLNAMKVENSDTVSQGDVIESFVRSQQGTFCSEFEQKVIEDPLAFQRCTVSVLWEDDHCAVVIKPQGMPVFRTKESCSPGAILSSPTNDDSFACLQTALPYSLTAVPANSILEPLRRPQVVHRLDKGTGGLLLVAKTRPALVNLTAQFSDRTVKKTYKAVVVGKLTNKIQPSLRAEEDCSEMLELYPSKMVVGSIATQLSGQDALTEWSVQPGMQTRSSLYGWITTVDLSPHTGRTHQLRRHMDILGHPIMGDPDYWFQDGGRLSAFSTAARNESTPFPVRLEGRGMFLWSVGISFNHPASGERMVLSIPEPDSYLLLRNDLG